MDGSYSLDMFYYIVNIYGWRYDTDGLYYLDTVEVIRNFYTRERYTRVAFSDTERIYFVFLVHNVNIIFMTTGRSWLYGLDLY